MSKISQAIEKINKLKNLERCINELYSINKTYTEVIVKAKGSKPIGLTLNFEDFNLSINYNNHLFELLLKDSILKNKAKIKSYKAQLIKLV